MSERATRWAAWVVGDSVAVLAVTNVVPHRVGRHDLIGTGLQGMRDRLEALGGVLTVESSPGAGTTVAGTVPTETRVPA